MAIPISIPDFTHLTFLYLLLCPFPISSLNITDLLIPYPQFSDFASLLASTAADISSRSSITILAVPNDHIHTAVPSSSSILADVLRYHVLLQYLSLSDLRDIPLTGKLVATLYQPTGRAPVKYGDVNITYDSSSNTVAFHSLATTSNATMLPLNVTLGRDNEVSILPLDSLMIPYNPDIMASETRPPPGINITKELIDGHDFNVAASMLTGSGVVSQFEAAEGGAGITLFVPTDAAFSDLPPHVSLQSLPAEQKAIVLKFHVLHSYYTLGTLESIVNPIYPTLATEQIGAGKFTVNILRVNGTVAIDTGVVLASITQTVFDENPVSIFGVSKVLLPREYFGGGVVLTTVPPPDTFPSSPESPLEANGPSSNLTAPLGPELSSSSPLGERRTFTVWWCIILWCVVAISKAMPLIDFLISWELYHIFRNRGMEWNGIDATKYKEENKEKSNHFFYWDSS